MANICEPRGFSSKRWSVQDLLHHEQEQQQQQQQQLAPATMQLPSSYSLTGGSDRLPQGHFFSMSIPDTELVAAFQTENGGSSLAGGVRRGSESDLVQIHRLQQQQQQQYQQQQQQQQQQRQRQAPAVSGSIKFRNEETIFKLEQSIELGRSVEADHLEHLEHCSNVVDATAGLETSRTLIVCNAAGNVSEEELSSIFQSFGDVRTLYTSASRHGLILVSYFDLRASVSALNTLQGTLVSNMPLEIQFSSSKPGKDVGINEGTIVVFNLDPDATNQHLAWLFSKFGEVKDVSESPMRANQKFVTFFDIRHAAAASQAMNCAENLDNLPEHITPQQAASLAHIAGSAASLAQLAHAQSSEGGEGLDRIKSLSAAQWNPSNQGGGTSVEQLLNRLTQEQQLGTAPCSSSSGNLHGGSPFFGTSPPEDLRMGSRAGLRFGSQGDLQATHAHAANMLPRKQHGDLVADSRSMHLSDSASSISAAAAKGGQFYGAGAGASMLGGNKGGMSGQMPGMLGGGNHSGSLGQSLLKPGANMDPGSGMYSASTAVDRQAQQLLMQSGMSHAEAASMLMSLNLPQQQTHFQSQAMHHKLPYGGMMWPGGFGHHLNPIVEGSEVGGGGGSGGSCNASAQLWANSMFGGVGAGASNSTSSAEAVAAMANQLASLELQQRQALQQQQQHQHASYSMQQQQQQQQQYALAAQLASYQAALACGVNVNGPGGNPHLAQAQQLLQAAQLNQALAQMSQQESAFASNMAAVQLLQQAGMGPLAFHGLGNHLAASQAAAALAAHNPLTASIMSQLAAQQVAASKAGGDSGGGGPAGGASSGGGNSSSSAADATRSGGRLSRRTTDPTAEAERKTQQEKLYALNYDRIRSGEDRRTTLMVKNIPNKYTQKMLLATIDEHFRGTYDFFYLPIDFKNKCNVGYAFINMLQPINIIPLVERFNHKKWERFNSEKVCHISYARIQGRSSLVAHFQNSSLMHEDKRCRPILFSTDGVEVGEQEPFPAGGGLRSAGGSSNSLHGLGHTIGTMSKSSSQQKLANSASSGSLAGTH